MRNISMFLLTVLILTKKACTGPEIPPSASSIQFSVLKVNFKVKIIK